MFSCSAGLGRKQERESDKEGVENKLDNVSDTKLRFGVKPLGESDWDLRDSHSAAYCLVKQGHLERISAANEFVQFDSSQLAGPYRPISARAIFDSAESRYIPRKDIAPFAVELSPECPVVRDRASGNIS